jgi:hypothetical protein
MWSQHIGIQLNRWNYANVFVISILICSKLLVYTLHPSIVLHSLVNPIVRFLSFILTPSIVAAISAGQTPHGKWGGGVFFLVAGWPWRLQPPGWWQNWVGFAGFAAHSRSEKNMKGRTIEKCREMDLPMSQICHVGLKSYTTPTWYEGKTQSNHFASFSNKMESVRTRVNPLHRYRCISIHSKFPLEKKITWLKKGLNSNISVLHWQPAN